MQNRQFGARALLTVGAVLAGLSASGVASAAVIYGVSNTNNLVTFNSATPGTIDSSLLITGMQPGETTIGLDFRPLNEQLYALGSFSRLYTVNPTTGVATLVGPLGLTLNGTAFGFDFNPSIDRIRVVSESDRNYVINPDTGLATQATNLFYGPGDPNFGVNPNVVGSAYSNNIAGTPTTQLYGIDTNLDILVTQANSAGTLGTVGPLGVDVSAILGFDIEHTGTAYAAMLPASGSISNLYTINLATGASTLLGQIDGGLTIVDITLPVIPEPSSLALAAAVGLIAVRRRK